MKNINFIICAPSVRKCVHNANKVNRLIFQVYFLVETGCQFLVSLTQWDLTCCLTVARPVASMCQITEHRLGPHHLTFEPSPVSVSSIFGLCVTVTFDMRSPSDRKTPLKGLSKDNCASSQQIPCFFSISICPASLHRACSKTIWMNFNEKIWISRDWMNL